MYTVLSILAPVMSTVWTAVDYQNFKTVCEFALAWNTVKQIFIYIYFCVFSYMFIWMKVWLFVYMCIVFIQFVSTCINISLSLSVGRRLVFWLASRKQPSSMIVIATQPVLLFHFSSFFRKALWRQNQTHVRKTLFISLLNNANDKRKLRIDSHNVSKMHWIIFSPTSLRDPQVSLSLLSGREGCLSRKSKCYLVDFFFLHANKNL